MSNYLIPKIKTGKKARAMFGLVPLHSTGFLALANHANLTFIPPRDTVKFSLTWLKRYLDIDKSPKEIEEALNLSGLEVEEVIIVGLPDLEKVLVGEVVKRDQHPDADRLSVCEVTTGGEELHTIVCGAQNFKEGDRVPVALPGAVLPATLKSRSLSSAA